ncbi:DMT family transporter [Poseidonocella sp. HB161398]|uniref:DMT family transporter n=1 Tax=Poseidonocella sp. HB161398 TaxID=2320855 RepID=UPI0011080546|nr:EamA family transporter [Poseidonocella sp. HB161398]
MTAADRRTGTAAILLAALLWSTTGTAATFAPAVSAAAIGAAAMGIGGLLQALTVLPGLCRGARAIGRQWRLLLPGAVAVALYPLAFYASMRLAGVAIGTVVTIGAAPLLAGLIERLLEGRHLSLRWLAGALCGVAGVLAICLAESAGHAAAGPDVATGILLGLLGAASYALYSWTARGMMQRGIPGREAMGATFGLGGLFLMPVLLLTGGPFLESWVNAATGLYMALVPMFLGYLAFGYGLARVPVSLATTLTLLEPAVAALLAALVLGEQLAALGWTGIGLVLASLVIVTLPLRLPALARRGAATL